MKDKIKIKRFGLIEVTEEHLARADGRSLFFLMRLKSLARARADWRSSLRRATSDERRNSGFTVVSVVVVLKRTTLKWPLTEMWPKSSIRPKSSTRPKSLTQQDIII